MNNGMDLNVALRKALITGITGQDGAYLSQLLLGKGYEVHGLIRRSASADVVGARLDWLGVKDRIISHDGNLTDISSLIRVLREVQPDEIYNLGAQSFVKSSWHQPQRQSPADIRFRIAIARALRCPTFWGAAGSCVVTSFILRPKGYSCRPTQPNSRGAAVKFSPHLPRVCLAGSGLRAWAA